ncbi:hypothetical protein Maq22A_c28305 [Methylobacterium aquaticum]|uniref:Uncharacterized protein n=1 Tax=Methylobacterium aquaticum TaxID=270351 RepID=A0A1Y0ZCD9_9HYPH|nr:hypothetical protein Maq22A_c28305 [Methylobacterium aquaticum]
MHTPGPHPTCPVQSGRRDLCGAVNHSPRRPLSPCAAHRQARVSARRRATSTPDNRGPSMLKTITYAMIGVLACGLVVAVVGASGTLLPG